MAKRKRHLATPVHRLLEPLRTRCEACGGPLWIAYHNTRTVATLDGLVHLTAKIRRCETRTCTLYHRPYRPEEEGGWALPHGEFGLDVIAWLGSQRYAAHRTVPELHQALRARGVDIAERTVTHRVERYDELLTLRLTDQRLCDSQTLPHSTREPANPLPSLAGKIHSIKQCIYQAPALFLIVDTF